MSIKVWPKNERPREKLLQHGAESLSDAELIAVLLGKGVKGKGEVACIRTIGFRFRFGSNVGFVAVCVFAACAPDSA